MRLGEVKPLSRGEIEARNAGYKPHSPETWRAWEYWATRAGCAELLQKK
jgi:HCOMODA/2-hydroxy-3-carboxy-muconic semialdehyde decarboxylase